MLGKPYLDLRPNCSCGSRPRRGGLVPEEAFNAALGRNVGGTSLPEVFQSDLLACEDSVGESRLPRPAGGFKQSFSCTGLASVLHMNGAFLGCGR